VPPPLAPKADAVDYAGAMARIYQQAGVHSWLASDLVREFMDAVRGHLRLRSSAATSDIVRTWEQRHPESQLELAGLLELAEELERGGEEVSRGKLLTAAQALDRFRASRPGRALARQKRAGQ